MLEIFTALVTGFFNKLISDVQQSVAGSVETYLLSTHDLSTMIPAMHEQLRLFASCSPIVLVPDLLPISLVIEDILLLDECSVERDWASGVIYLSLR